MSKGTTSPATTELTHAIFDAWSRKLRGGFKTEAAAWEWFEKHPPVQIRNEEGREVGVVATAFEADLLLQEHPEWSKRRMGREDGYRVCFELN